VRALFSSPPIGGRAVREDKFTDLKKIKAKKMKIGYY